MIPTAGHRLVAHTADCIIEAWAPERPGCLSEALAGLVASFAEVDEGPATRVVPLSAGPAGAEDLLVALLEDVIFAVDVLSIVPVRFHLGDTEDGGVSGDMEVVPLAATRIVGPEPKAVSYHDLSVVHDRQGWRCHVVVDV